MWLYPAGGKRGTNALTYYYENSAGRHPRRLASAQVSVKSWLRECNDDRMPRGSDNTKTVIRISPMAHLASAFLFMALLTVGPAFGAVGMVVLLMVPVLVSVVIERFRTVADAETVTTRTLLKSRTVRWPQIEGLSFTRGRWARAHLTDESDLLLPAVTFATLPRLTAASGGRVPNPYQR